MMPALIKSATIRNLVLGDALASSDYLPALSFIRDSAFWKNWGRNLLFAFGAAHVLAGFIFFFAFNWNALSQFAKFALVEGGVVISVLLWISLRLDKYATSFGIAATIFIGISFAVFGQVFQTPAMVYTPFTLWALFSLPFAIVSRSHVHWAVWLVISLVALGTYVVTGLKPLYGEIAAHNAYGVAALAVFIFLVSYDKFVTPRLENSPLWFRLFLVFLIQLYLYFLFVDSYFGSLPLFAYSFAAVCFSTLLTIYLFKVRPLVASLSLSTFALILMLAQLGLKLDLVNKDLFVPLLLNFVWLVFLTGTMAYFFRFYQGKFGQGGAEQVQNLTSENILETARSNETLSKFGERFSLEPVNLAAVDLKGKNDATWYMEISLGFLGIIAAVLGIVFLGYGLFVTFGIDKDPEAILTLAGAVLFFTALAIRRKGRSIFVRHFLNSLIMVGYISCLVGIANQSGLNEFMPLIGIVLAIATIFFVRDVILEFLMGAAIIGWLTWQFSQWDMSHRLVLLCLIAVVLSLFLLTRPIRNRIYQGVGAAFLLMPPIIILISKAASFKVFYIGHKAGLSQISSIDHWLGAGLVLGGAYYLNRVMGRTLQNIDPALFIIVPLALVCIVLPVGMPMIVIAILAGYILGEKSLAIAGSLLQVGFLVWFYYDLSTTLLVKSLILISIGLLVLFLWWLSLPGSRFNRRAQI